MIDCIICTLLSIVDIKILAVSAFIIHFFNYPPKGWTILDVLTFIKKKKKLILLLSFSII